MQNLTVVPGHYATREEFAEMAKKEGITKADAYMMYDQNAQEDSILSDGYTVLIGHRRMAAAKEAGLTELPCVITEMNYGDQIATMMIENIQRTDLTVYEQAHGFQTMLDIGFSIEEISKKSGFSTTTVKRRVKMMELNQDVLKEVSERQLSLADFDELAKIEDINVRNKCLKEIGTHNFKQSVASEIRRQEINKKIPKVKEQMKEAKAKALKQSDMWSSEYEAVTVNIYITEWDGISQLIPKNATGKVYYYLDDFNGRISIYKKREKAKPVKKSPAELEREKKIADAHAALEEKAAVAYNLRTSFVKNISWNKKNAEAILNGALIAGVLNAITYMGSDRNTIGKLLGIDVSNYDSDRGSKTLTALHELDTQKIPTIIYAMFYDSPKAFTASYKGCFPRYRPSAEINGLYMWLTSLGYEMSDDEKALQDGTHELFHCEEDVQQ